ncbi:glycosyltransferase family 1 protein [Humibacter sp.]|jgi:glycosyltransferase involved in cell wall biosynthesis|uniref:glycosyltransferase family 4 protein n=1 Tax=Humibacter sp. TaxID=1940291 RepID=UPI002D0E8255|nr:glycosyltransferase family 1 protein [Humibacter sp.]HVX07827.1 glycosyltransferase family 1 protein [Humibacter sp.]
MTTLRVIVDDVLTDVPDGISRYSLELTRQLIATAPRGCVVEGIVAARSETDRRVLQQLLPGLVGVHALPVGSRELALAWQMGVKLPMGGGLIHAPSLLAPLFKHDASDSVDQTTVTVHDVSAWTAPEAVGVVEAAWQKAMVKRARKFADAVVVPTHAVADQLNQVAKLGDRIRVIGGAPSDTLQVPDDADARAGALRLPERYIATVSSLDPRRGLRALIGAMTDPALHDLPLLVVGPEEHHGERVSTVAMEAGLAEGRVRTLGSLGDPDLAVVLSRATVFVYPNLSSGFGLPVVEAMRFGTPVVHSDDPAVAEVAFGAGVTVPREDSEGYPARLAEAVSSVVADDTLRERLRFAGMDRAAAFSWRASAESVWQLHAEL